MTEQTNQGLGVSEDRARQLMMAREKQIESEKTRMQEFDQPEPTAMQQEAPPPGIKTARDLNYLDQKIAEREAQTPQERQNSLGKASIFQKRQNRVDNHMALQNELGAKNSPLDNLPSGGIFYIPGTEITIRAARVDEIRHFSTIDDGDMIDVDDKLNYIVERCVKIRIPGKGMQSYRDILELDRFYLVFAVRELTFSEGENKIQMSVACDECQHTDTVDIKRDHFHLVSLDDKLQKHINFDNRCLSFKMRDGEELDLFFPTIGITEYIKKYLRGRAESGKQIDTSFIQIAPFLFEDWRALNDAIYNNTNFEVNAWSLQKISVAMGIIEMLKQSGDNRITHQCTSCGSEVRQEISFRGGLKSLFIITDIWNELL